jgi:hypothetical protein
MGQTRPSLVATLACVSSGDQMASEWRVAFYERVSVPAEEIIDVDGIAFCFYQGGEACSRLDGATLCYENGSFRVDEADLTRRSSGPLRGR